MGLRLAEGIDRQYFQTRTGQTLAQSVDPGILAAAEEEGYVRLTDTHLIATAEGRLRLDALLAALVR
jgi:oxygen-independent coproporphyrinogen-3 oxidase